MSEMISSVVVQETVSQILSGLVRRYEGKEDSNSNDNLERLEMAHIKLEAALETSAKWHITDSSLLRWQKKLKRAAQECDDMLYKYKKTILEEEQIEQEVRSSSFPIRIAHAAKSFIFSAFGRNNNSSGSVVRRFEWFADGASDFVRFVEFGGTPCHHMSYNSFVKHLFAGKELQHKIFHGNEYPLFLLWLVPFATEEHGIEACLVFIKKDRNKLEDNCFFKVMLQVSESTDIVGTAIKCLSLFPPHFQPAVETIKKELTQPPTQDFSWVPYVDLWHRRHWDNLHSIGTQWVRPDPLCCKQHDQHKVCRISNLDMVGLSDVSLRSVSLINLQCRISLSEYNIQCTSLSEFKNSGKEYQNLRAGLIFAPHRSLALDSSSAMAPFHSGEQVCGRTDITLEQRLKEVMLRKAIDYFYQNTEATVYQMVWNSRHSTAYIQFGKASIEAPGAQRSFRGARARKRKLVQEKDEAVKHRTRMTTHLIDLWDAHAPLRLKGLILDWVQKEKQSQLTAPLKF